MGLFDRLFGRRKAPPATESVGSELVSSVPQDRIGDFTNGNLVKCSVCGKRLTVELAETAGLKKAGHPGGGTFFPSFATLGGQNQEFMSSMSPEMSGKMRQLKRLILSYADFKHAKLASTMILEGQLHDKYPNESYVVLEALNCSMIVAYCRPFSGNDPGVPGLPGRLLRCLSSDERDVHEVVMRDRNKVLAHSDADTLRVEPVIWQVAGKSLVVPLKEWGLAPLTKEVTRVFQSAAVKLLDATIEERARLEPQLIPFMRVADPENPFA